MNKIYFYYQNLKKEDREKCLIHGRCWLGHDLFHAEWSIPSHFWHIQLSLNHYGDTAIGFSFAVGLFSIHISTDNHKLYKLLERFTKRKDQKYTNGRVIGLSFHSNALWVSLWDDPMESRSVDPWWWHFSIQFDDLILGKAKHNLEVIKEGDTMIDMPEGKYETHYKIQRRTWSRPRWFPKMKEEVSFDIPIGIPHEGKGENSWDCEMDATFGCGTYWDGKLHEATKRIAMNCLKDRQRYGSLNSPEYAKWRNEKIKIFPTSAKADTNRKGKIYE